MAKDQIIIVNRNEWEALENKLDQILNILNLESQTGQAPTEWIPEKEVKKMLGLGTTTLWKLRKQGVLEYSKPNNSIVY